MEVCLIYNSTLFSGVQHNNSVFLQIALHYKLPKGNDYSSLCYTICPCCLSLSYFLKYIHTHPFLLSNSVNCPFPGSIVTPLTTPSGVTLSLSLSPLSLFSWSVMSYSLRLHGLKHTKLPCPSPSPGVCSNLCPSNR